MPTLVDEISVLKTQAKNRRDLKRYECVVSILNKVIGLAERSPGALAPSMVSWHADAAASLTPQATRRRRGGRKGFGILIRNVNPLCRPGALAPSSASRARGPQSPRGGLGRRRGGRKGALFFLSVEHITPQGITVKVTPLDKIPQQYRERREYISEEEESRYEIVLRYNRVA
jgi:hypothetical protein